MKRNWDLIRAILTVTEDAPAGAPVGCEEVAKLGFDVQDVRAHIKMMGDAGLLEARTAAGAGTAFPAVILATTMAGHDLADSMRQTPFWEKIKAYAAKKGIELSFDAVKAIAALLIKQAIAE